MLTSEAQHIFFKNHFKFDEETCCSLILTCIFWSPVNSAICFLIFILIQCVYFMCVLKSFARLLWAPGVPLNAGIRAPHAFWSFPFWDSDPEPPQLPCDFPLAYCLELMLGLRLRKQKLLNLYCGVTQSTYVGSVSRWDLKINLC